MPRENIYLYITKPDTQYDTLLFLHSMSYIVITFAFS